MNDNLSDRIFLMSNYFMIYFVLSLGIQQVTVLNERHTRYAECMEEELISMPLL